MSYSTIWWLIAGATIVAELLSGTVYLLLLSAGFAAAALSAHAGAGVTVQLVVAAVVGVGGVLIWRAVRGKRPAKPAAGANPDLNLDIGGIVFVDDWKPDGTATVRYRGTQWTVVPRTGIATSVGEHRVAEVVGSRLVVDKV